MKALNTIKFPRMAKVQRTKEERQYDESNQFRMNQNFKFVSDSISRLEEEISKIPDVILGEITVPMDWVISSGDLDGWSYRKWNGKTAECWDDSVEIQKTFSTASGSFYYEDQEINLPASLFSSVRIVQVSVASATVPMSACIQNISTTCITIRLISPVDQFVSCKLMLSVSGKWEEAE